MSYEELLFSVEAAAAAMVWVAPVAHNRTTQWMQVKRLMQGVKEPNRYFDALDALKNPEY